MSICVKRTGLETDILFHFIFVPISSSFPFLSVFLSYILSGEGEGEEKEKGDFWWGFAGIARDRWKGVGWGFWYEYFPRVVKYFRRVV